MDVRDLVSSHYGGADLAGRVLGALGEAGVELDRLRPEDLAAVDQLHAGGAPATAHLLEVLLPDPAVRLLDVGCGIGGGARMAAAQGATVTGIDLTPELVEAARVLTERVGLADRVRFETTAGESLQLEDGSFDAAMMIHVGMNVPDKKAVFDEVRRVLRPGGAFAIFEQMRSGDGDLPYPLPWAEDERTSFVESPHAYGHQLTEAGFEVMDTIDRTSSVGGLPPPGGLSPSVLFGPEFGRRIANNVAATQAGDLCAVLMVARAV